MIIATYDQWLAGKAKECRENLAADGEPPKLKCGQCSGCGTITDHGVITDEEFEATCNECDGVGTIDINDGEELNISSLRIIFKRRDYLEEVLRDLRQLARFTSQPEWLVLSANGWEVYSDIKTKHLVVEWTGEGFFKESREVIH